MLTPPPEDFATRLLERIDRLAACSEPGPGVSRRPFTPEHRAASDLVAGWMEAAGLEVRRDPMGTLIGRRPGPPGALTLLTGSHLDSVRGGGRFDGALGILLPILALEHLRDAELPVAVEVLALPDEEGVRFPDGMAGARAITGLLPDRHMQLRDAQGEVYADALRAFGGDPDRVAEARRDPRDLFGYLELHIEQGPVLERLGQPVGVVTAIQGVERWAVELAGAAGHAGATPMELRRDALAGAAELILSVERMCRAEPGLIASVGRIETYPNLVNGVPASASLSVELRAPEDRPREAAAVHLRSEVWRICAERGLGCDMRRFHVQPARICDPGLANRLAAAVAADSPEVAPVRLPSGPAHDAAVMADLCPSAMLFLRCREGLTHHADECVDEAAILAAARVFVRFLHGLSAA